ncbi:MAG: glycosyltransferase family 2 protein [Armatimonadota bacterium]
MKLSIIIPVYNEINTLPEVLEKLRALDMDMEIIAADDFSTDGSREYLREQSDVILVENPTNLGKGSAIRKALEQVSGDIIIIQDADLEYDPIDFPKLIQPIIDNEADMVYGTRFTGKRPHMKLANYLANKLFAFIASTLYRNKITDEATCYKAFRTDIIRDVTLTCKRFEFCPEITAKTLKRGARFKEVPISYYPRTAKEGKKIGWLDGLECLWALIKYRFKD